MDAEFNYQQGGNEYGKYYPALKPTELAIHCEAEGSSTYYHYEPGNGTRYEVIFTEIELKEQFEKELIIVMTIIQPRRRSMITPSYNFHMKDLGYMMEKLEMHEGDCYALIQLINIYLDVR